MNISTNMQYGQFNAFKGQDKRVKLNIRDIFLITHILQTKRIELFLNVYSVHWLLHQRAVD